MLFSNKPTRKCVNLVLPTSLSAIYICSLVPLNQFFFSHTYNPRAKLTAIQIRLVSDRKLKRIQRRKYREVQAKLFDLWDQFEANQRSARKLLKACSYLNGPRE